MAINTLYFGSSTNDWQQAGLKILDSKNIEKSIKSTESLDYGTSINDLSFSNLHLAFENSRIIDFKYADVNTLYTHTDFFVLGHFLYLCNKYKLKIQNELVLPNMSSAGHSLVSGRHLWTAGCSYTYGTGVEKSQRWAALLSEKLALPEISLASPGTSIPFAANQILQSDIKPDDIVVWGLTNTGRVEIARDWELWATTIGEYVRLPHSLQYYNVDYFDSKTNILRARDSILQVINFCSKIKAKLVLANLLDIAWLPIMFKDCTRFIDLTASSLTSTNGILVQKHIDYGSDNQHPGPLQHQYYASRIYEFINSQ